MNSFYRFFKHLCVGLVLGMSMSAMALTPNTSDTQNGVTHSNQVNPSQAIRNHNGVDIVEVKRFSEVFHQIKRYYVDSVDDSKLFENAIRGMLNGLDPHSDYLNVQEFKALHNNTEGKFAGLGIQISVEHGFLKVVSPLDGTPAHRAGVKAGDYIIRLDETPVKGMTLSKAIEKMRGKKGSTISLTVVRQGVDKPLQFKIIRDFISVKSVKSQYLGNGYGYVRVSQFQLPTVDELRKAIVSMRTRHGKELNGLIVDLRNNPGGLLDSAVEMSDLFLDAKLLGTNKKIVYTKGRLAQSVFEVKATKGDILAGAPIVLLLNQGSASGSEIVAGALQDHKRAIVVGEKSFGKGSVQTVLPLGGNRGMKITTAVYFTPNGRSIQAKGIVPDVRVKEVKLAKDYKPDANLQVIREEHLTGHIEIKDGKVKQKVAKKLTKVQELMKDDYQLQQALNVLKGLNIQRQKFHSRVAH